MANVYGYENAIMIPILFELTYSPVPDLSFQGSIEKPIDEFHNRLGLYYPEAAKYLKTLPDQDHTKFYTKNQWGLKKLEQESVLEGRDHPLTWDKRKSYDVPVAGINRAQEAFCAAFRLASARKDMSLAEFQGRFCAYQKTAFPAQTLQDVASERFVGALRAVDPSTFRSFLQFSGVIGLAREILAKHLRACHALK